MAIAMAMGAAHFISVMLIQTLKVVVFVLLTLFVTIYLGFALE